MNETDVREAKPGKGKPFDGTLRVTSPVRQSLASGRKRVLRGAGATRAAKRSGYRNGSGDASIGGQGETAEVSQPHVQEVIPMSSKAYRTTRRQRGELGADSPAERRVWA